MKKYFKTYFFIALLFCFPAWSDSVPQEGVLGVPNNIHRFIQGTALGVSRNGFIDLKLRGSEEHIKLRPWALEVSPEVLAAVVQGRRLDCLVIYQNKDHVAGECVFHFPDSERECTIQNDLFCRRNQVSVNLLLVENFNARRKCGKYDYENLSITILGDPDFMPFPQRCAEYEAEDRNERGLE